jgi:hypothetical protein
VTDTSEGELAAGPSMPGASPPVPLPPPAPRWVAPLYLVLAVLLVPWTVYLGIVLPDHTTSAHWDVAWVGFDAAIVCALVLTAWCAYRRTNWVESSAAATATLLIVDAWFDCTTARGGSELAQALVQAVVVELPLAVLSLWIARHAVAVHSMAAGWAARRRR